MKTRTTIFNRAIGPAATALALSCGLWSAAADQYSTAVLADHPLALWQLNDTSGTTAVDSVGGHNGVYTNVTLNLNGYNQGTDPSAIAAGFGSSAGQSSDSYVGGLALDFATNANAEFSAEAWVQGYSQTTGAGIFGKGAGGSGEEFYLDCGGTGGAFRFFARNAAGQATNASSTIIPDGNWHYLVGVCDQVNNKLLLYVDAVQVASAPMTGGIKSTANANMNIGSRQSAASGSYDFQFNGNISDVAAYNVALTPAQILAHYYAAGIPPVITVQPTNSVTVNEGGTFTLSIAARGNPVLDYNWSYNGNVLQDGTNNTLTVTNVSANLNGAGIFVVVSNAYGTVQSQGTQITVNSGPPSVLVDVGPPQLSLFNGIAHTYTIAVTGTVPVYYQWLLNGAAIPGATNATYAATSATGAASYSVAISNAYNGGSITLSSTAVLNGVPVPTNTYPTAIIADHPLAYYRLGETNGATIAADNLGGHDGTYNNTGLGFPGYTALDANTSAQFGVLATADSYVGENINTNYGIPQLDFAAPTGSNAQFTIEAWVNAPPGQMPAGSAIVAKGIAGSEEFVVDASSPSGNFRFFTRKPNGGGVNSILSSSAPDGHWHYIVAVCDEIGGAVSLYVDTAIVGQITGLGGTGLNESSLPLSIGAQNSGFDYTYQYDGLIDEVAVYNYALTPAQIKAHYASAPLAPYFVSTPATNISALPGQKITLAVSALGSAPLHYQWYSNSVAIPGQTIPALTLNSLPLGNYTFSVIVFNVFGTITTTTMIQVSSGTGAPTLVMDLADTARYTTLPLTYSVIASGSSPLYYFWSQNGTLLQAGTNNSYSIPSVSLSSAGPYSCLVSNSLGTIQSSTSTLTVAPIPTNAYPKLIITDHPVAYFRLDETNNSALGYDYVGGNEGQYEVPSQIQQGVPGYNTNLDSDLACRFGITGASGQTDYLGNTATNFDFATPNGLNAAFSVEAWVNGTNSGTQLSGAAIVAKGGGGNEQFALDCHAGFRFYVRNAANATAINANSSPLVAGTLSGTAWQMDGKWHHVVGVCDQVNSNLLIYVDGKLIGPNIITNGVVPFYAVQYDAGVVGTGTNGSVGINAGITETTNNVNGVASMSIGNRNKGISSSNPYNLPFYGMLDEVAVYGYALTPAQVANHYNTALGIVTQVPLMFHVTNGQLVLTWTAGTLVSSPTPNGTYTAVSGAVSPYTVPITGTQQYFRLKFN